MSVRSKLVERAYTSVATFSADLARVFTSEIGVQPAGDTAELQMQISGRAPELSLEQREKRKLAKRIIKAIQPALEDAIKKESELNGKPFEKELKDLDLILENSVSSRRASISGGSAEQETPEKVVVTNGVNGDNEEQAQAITKAEPGDESPHVASADATDDMVMLDANQQEAPNPVDNDPGPAPAPMAAAASMPGSESENIQAVDAHVVSDPTTIGIIKDDESDSSQLPSQAMAAQQGPPTPPLSFEEDQQLPLAQGGIMWYMQPFDPIGTTIHEERWTGRDVMRGMSEELSELDEDELNDLVDNELEEGTEAVPNGTCNAGSDVPAEEQKVKVHRTRRRWRGFK